VPVTRRRRARQKRAQLLRGIRSATGWRRPWPGRAGTSRGPRRSLASREKRCGVAWPATGCGRPAGGAGRPRRPGSRARAGRRGAWAGGGGNIAGPGALLGITRNAGGARRARWGLGAAGGGAEETEPSGITGPPVIEGGEPLPESRPSEAAVAPVAGRVDRTSGRPSIAVLPLSVEGGDDPGRAYFGEGVVEGIIGSLAALRELFVISRTSTSRYRGGADVRVVGQELGVSYVLSGNIRRIDDRLRLAVELAESRQGTVVWGRHFDGMATDLF